MHEKRKNHLRQGSDMDSKVSTQFSEIHRKVQSDPITIQPERENSITQDLKNENLRTEENGS